MAQPTKDGPTFRFAEVGGSDRWIAIASEPKGLTNYELNTTTYAEGFGA